MCESTVKDVMSSWVQFIAVIVTTLMYRGRQKFPGNAAIGIHGMVAWELLADPVHAF